MNKTTGLRTRRVGVAVGQMAEQELLELPGSQSRHLPENGEEGREREREMRREEGRERKPRVGLPLGLKSIV